MLAWMPAYHSNFQFAFANGFELRAGRKMEWRESWCRSAGNREAIPEGSSRIIAKICWNQYPLCHTLHHLTISLIFGFSSYVISVFWLYNCVFLDEQYHDRQHLCINEIDHFAHCSSKLRPIKRFYAIYILIKWREICRPGATVNIVD